MDIELNSNVDMEIDADSQVDIGTSEDILINTEVSLLEADVEMIAEDEIPIEITFKEEIVIDGETRDYRKLINKPTINGEELYDNYDEIDPTVPSWAKEETKPSYTAEEVGAIDQNSEMSLADIKAVWDSVFNP